MHLGQPAKKKGFLLIGGVIGFLGLLFLSAFRREILWILGVPPDADILLTGEVISRFTFLLYTIVVGFFLIFFLWIILLSFQTLLPVSNIVETFQQSLLEVYRTAWHFFLYLTRMHGQAIFVEDGQANTTSEDLKREEWPGVVVVDFNSAVVLEERNPPPGLARVFYSLIQHFLEAAGLSDPHESPRVRGAGIVYTRPRERIRGVVDLRRQFRMQMRVPCYSREGIELQSNIFSVFTIGQDPDILQVMFAGPRRPENLRTVTFEKSPTYPNQLQVARINNDLDDADRAEIFNMARAAHHAHLMQPYRDPPDTSRQVFNHERVFSAVYSQARDNRHDLLPWTELPTRVGADFYRDILSQVNFDELYDIGENGPLPIDRRFRASLRSRMRNNGILAYRLIETCNEEQLVAGHRYAEANLMVSETRELTNSKVLRDRGIKIIFCSFGDPIPVNEAVYQQRLDAWRAGWDRDLNITQATYDLAAMRVRTRAYVNAQKDLWYSLSQLFEPNQFSDEALALRLLQALEKAADDPKTRALLPKDTIALMRNIHALLLPGEFVFPIR